MYKHIPNFITSLNLLSGCIALAFAFEGELILSSLFIGAGALFDFADGFAARLLRVKSKIGKELDSLADIVTFGVVPGALVYQLMQQDINAPVIFISDHSMLPFIGFLIPVFSALRLAKFNIDSRQERVFYGMPTPATAIFLGSFPLILGQDSIPFGLSIDTVHEVITNFYVLVSLTVLVSWLMVSEIPLFSLKFNSFSWQSNAIRYLFLGMSIVLFSVLYFVSIPIIIFLYIIISLIYSKKVMS